MEDEPVTLNENNNINETGDNTANLTPAALEGGEEVGGNHVAVKPSVQKGDEIALSVFSNTAFDSDADSESGAEKQHMPTPPSIPPPLNLHESIAGRRSMPPTSAPPVFLGDVSPNFPLVSPTVDDGDEEKHDIESNTFNYHVEDDDNDDDNDEVKTKKSKIIGILRHRSSVRDPNAANRNVTWGALPKRRGEDPNPCVLLILLILFIISSVSFLLILLVLRGSLKPPCGCDDEIKESVRGHFQETNMKCPVGWSVREKSCYGIVVDELVQYSEAKAKCSTHGGYVLSLETESESKWFTRNILRPRNDYNQGQVDIFLGLKPGNSSNSNSRSYQWESLRPFANWNRNIKAGNDSCFSVTSDGAWNNIDCSRKLAFYCERQQFT